jgi:hypothetical protein
MRENSSISAILAQEPKSCSDLARRDVIMYKLKNKNT